MRSDVAGPDGRRTAAPQPLQLVARAITGDLAWVKTGGWTATDLLAQAEEHGVHLLLWRALRDCGPEELLEPLRRAIAGEVARSAIRDRELAGVIGRLVACHVEALVIKGGALAHSAYSAPWLRPRVDTDLLVDSDDVGRAADALAPLGYTRSSRLSTGQFVSHQIALVRTDVYGVEHIIDLHWCVLNPQRLAHIVGFRELQAGARVLSLGSTQVRVPSWLWSMVLACAHRLAHHQQMERLIWLYDIHLLAQHLDEADWVDLVAIARSRRISAICADGLAAAASYFGTAVPEDTLSRLRAAGTHDPSRRYVNRSMRRLAVLRDDLRHLSWGDRLRLLSEHVFPSAAFMRSRYGFRHGALLPFLYAHRLITGAVRWIRAS